MVESDIDNEINIHDYINQNQEKTIIRILLFTEILYEEYYGNEKHNTLFK